MKNNKNITDFIPVGRENALSMRELALRVGENERTVRKMVQAAREKGVPVCSALERPSGYFLPTDRNEATRYIRTQIARINTTRAAVNGICEWLGGVPCDE